jgi:hypothetical protein
VILTGFKGPVKALIAYGTTGADFLGLLNLKKSRTSITHREEELWIFGKASGLMTPVHHPPSRRGWGYCIDPTSQPYKNGMDLGIIQGYSQKTLKVASQA